SPNGTIVGDIVASDADPGDSLTFELVGGTGQGFFSVNPITGEIAVTNASVLDAETTTSFTLEIEVTDEANATATATMTINVTDINESGATAPIDSDSNDNEIGDSAVAGTPVGITAESYDTDASDSITYSLETGLADNDLFAIDPVTGIVTVVGPLDANSASSHTIEVTATSTDGSTATQQFTIDVLDETGPQITSVKVGSTTLWKPAFIQYVDPADNLGYEIPTGPDQLKTLPWFGINRIYISFSEHIVNSLGQTIDDADEVAKLFSVTVGDYGLLSVEYDDVDYVLTIKLNTPISDTFTSPFSGDKLRIWIDDAKVTDVAGNPLNGTWDNGVSENSGENTLVGDFDYRFNVMPGDVSQNGVVQSSDRTLTLASTTSFTFFGPYNKFADVDGSGSIVSNDSTRVLSRTTTFLPGGEPMGPGGFALIAAAIVGTDSEELKSDHKVLRQETFKRFDNK
ncbi:MAG: cadherin repeat domain-containing protein, partial [Planctomycetales bacterium]|nr:cadherin repeat domain-containing protein [Planctomycetales bacterium]